MCEFNEKIMGYGMKTPRWSSSSSSSLRTSYLILLFLEVFPGLLGLGLVAPSPPWNTAVRSRSQGLSCHLLRMRAGSNPKTWYPTWTIKDGLAIPQQRRSNILMSPSLEDPPEIDPRRRDPDTPSEAPPVRMPVVDVGDGTMDVISKLLSDRILLLGQQVNDEVANVLVAQLLYLANKDPSADITLYINSPGGSVSSGMAIYDTMQSHLARLFTFPRRGKRRALPNARIMIHQPLGGAQGQAADIEIQAKEILYIRACLNTYIADYTDQPVSKIEDDTDRDFFMTPEEAMDYGIIDEVITTKTSMIKKPPMPDLMTFAREFA